MNSAHLFGSFLVQNKVINQNQLIQAIKLQQDVDETLEVLALSKGLINIHDMKLILERQWEKNETFGEAALALELIEEEVLDEVHKELSKHHRAIGEILVAEEFITEVQLKEYLSLFQHQKSDVSKLRDILKTIPLFKRLGNRELSEIATKFSIREMKPGDLIYKEGDKSNYFNIIESGMARITLKLGNHEIELGSFQAGDYFGLESVLSRSPYFETTESIMNTKLWSLSWLELQDLLHEYPDLAVTATKYLGDNIRKLTTIFGDRNKVYESFVINLIVEPDISSIHELIFGIIKELLWLNNNEKFLFIYTLDKPELHEYFKKSPGTELNYNKANPLIKEFGYLYMPDVDSKQSLQKLLNWTASESRHFDTIVFIASTDNENFIKSLIGIGQRNVVVLRNAEPDFLKTLKTRTDRVYYFTPFPKLEDYARVTELFKRYPALLFHSWGTHNNRSRASKVVARWLTSKTVGLTLGGGGSRGLAHLGALEILEAEGIDFDIISGTSAGSIIGAMVALGMPLHEIQKAAFDKIIDAPSRTILNFHLPIKSLFGNAHVIRLAKGFFKEIRCFETGIPFYPVVTNMRTGTQAVLNDCYIWEAMCASSSAPPVLPMFHIKDMILGDGAMVNNVPTSVIRDDADFIITVNVSPEPSKTPVVETTLLDTLARILNIMVYQIIINQPHYADIEIRPKILDIGFFAHKEGRRLIELGREAALEKLPEIREQIKKFRPHS
ncbi:cyclic nucleotide-binding and patatin-like phospholipase domain-containing protein [Deltaproteobacteria bacterium TL4]